MRFYAGQSPYLPPEAHARERLAPAFRGSPFTYKRNLELVLSSIDFDGLTQLCSEVALSGQAIAR